MDHKISRGKGIVVNLDRIPVSEWGRIFEATEGCMAVYKVGTTLQRESVAIAREIRKHGELLIDTRLGDYLPDIDECIEMYKPFDPWGITFRCGNDFALRQAQFHQVMTSAIASVRIVGTDDECLRRNRASCDDLILQLAEEACREGITRILCSVRELEVIRKGLKREDLEFIVYGNYPLWNLDPGASGMASVLSPAEAISTGADFIIIAAPITVARTVSDPAGLVIEACREFAPLFPRV
jgi:hypothetical protein